MNVLLVDDEALARQRMRRLLAANGAVTVVAECSSGASALDALGTHRIDVVFLDIQMPGVDGFVVAESLTGPEAPLLVFVTAHDEHAVRAFETRALDYLLKPVRQERLDATLERAREQLASRRAAAYAARLRGVIAQLDDEGVTRPPVAVPPAAERIEVRDGDRVRFLDADDVSWVEANGAQVRLHTREGSVEIRATLAHLAASLDARTFVRIHRSYLVNVTRVRELLPWFGGDAMLVLQDGHRLKVSRTYRAQLRQRLNAV